MRVVGRGLRASWKMLVILVTSSLTLQSERTICIISVYVNLYATKLKMLCAQ